MMLSARDLAILNNEPKEVVGVDTYVRSWAESAAKIQKRTPQK